MHEKRFFRGKYETAIGGEKNILTQIIDIGILKRINDGRKNHVTQYTWEKGVHLVLLTFVCR
jgi:hypothetical protein